MEHVCHNTGGNYFDEHIILETGLQINYKCIFILMAFMQTHAIVFLSFNLLYKSSSNLWTKLNFGLVKRYGLHLYMTVQVFSVIPIYEIHVDWHHVSDWNVCVF